MSRIRETDRRKKNGRALVAVQYAAGVIFFLVCIAAAMFLPGAYAEWQDEQIMGQVNLSQREAIQFIDVEALDIEERLRMLQEAEDFWATETDYVPITISEFDFFNAVSRIIGQWCDAGLLPEGYEQLTQETDSMYFVPLIWGGMMNDDTEQMLLRLGLCRYYSPEGDDALTVVMDLEREFIYYASAAGDMAETYLIKELGYESSQEMEEYLIKNGTWKKETPDTESLDFASVCGAQDAEIISTPGRFELVAWLKFETFTGYAARSIVESDAQPGVAVMFGTDRWPDFFSQVMESHGFMEAPLDTESIMVDLFDSLDLSEGDESFDEEIPYMENVAVE